MTLEEIVERFRRRGFEVVRQGGGYRLECPAHPGEGKGHNLELKDRPGGGVEAHCYSHDCELPLIAESVGLKVSDFYPPAQPNGGKGLGEPEAAYPYRDEQGRTLFWVGRFAGKEFRQWKPGPEGQRSWGIGGIRRVLFGLPELLETAPGDLIGIVEGEKDAVNLAAAGVPATTCPMGAGKWRQEYTDWLKLHLADRRFLILPDNDAQGTSHAEEVYESLKRAGLDVAVVSLPDLPPKGDVTDWLRAGGTGAQLRRLAEPPQHPLSLRVIGGEKLQQLKLAEPEALVPNLVYRGFSTLLAGDSKLGKSSLLLRMMLAMAAQGWWLDRERREENRLIESRVLFLNFEDPLFLTRQRAMRMMAPEGIPEGFLSMEPPYEYSLPDIIKWLYDAKEEFNLDAVVLDPIAIAAEWEKEEDNAKVALTFKALQRLAAETQMAVLSAHHVSKKPGTFGQNIRGASAIKANVLGYLVLEREKSSIRLSGINKLTGEWDVSLGRDERDYSWWIEESHTGSTKTPHQIAKDEAKSDLLILIGGTPGVTTDWLRDVLELAESTVRVYLGELEEAGLIFSHDLPREEGQRGPNRRGWFRFLEGA